MTYFHVDVMWAMVLFGILLWTTVTVVLNAAMRRGMGTMGMLLSYAVLAWMLYDLPWRDAITTWMVFALLGGALTFLYELWARRRFLGRGRKPRPLMRLDGVLRWPALVPNAFGMVLNDLGVLPGDDRSETHEEDALRAAAARPEQSAPR